jgi:hypothetical protein
MTREELLKAVGEIVADEIETVEARLRSALFEKLLEHKRPDFKLSPKGVLSLNGVAVGDVKPIFREAVDEALAGLGLEPKGEEGGAS